MDAAKFLAILNAAHAASPLDDEVNSDHEAFYFGGPAEDSEEGRALVKLGALWSDDYDCWMVHL